MNKIRFLQYFDKSNTPRLGLPPCERDPFNSSIINYILSEKRSFSDLVEFYDLETMPKGEKYVVFLSWYNDFTKQFTGEMCFDFGVGPSTDRLVCYPMPNRVWVDSGNGLVHWVIDYSHESDILHPLFNKDPNKFFSTFNIKDSKDLTLIIGGSSVYSENGKELLRLSQEYGYNILNGTLWGFHSLFDQTDFSEYFTNKIDDIIKKVPLKYKSSCHNRIPKINRCFAIAYLQKHGLDKSCLYTYGGKELNQFHTDDYEDIFNNISDKDLISYISKLFTSEKINAHINEKVDLHINLADVVPLIHGKNSYFNIVTETFNETSDWTMITEKSLKPFLMLQPFISIGSAGNVNYLKKTGFKVFEEWIDHSYDAESDPIKRWEMALAEVKRLHELSDTQWNNMLVDMLDDLVYNHLMVTSDTLKNIIKSDLEKKLYLQLLKESR